MTSKQLLQQFDEKFRCSTRHHCGGKMLSDNATFADVQSFIEHAMREAADACAEAPIYSAEEYIEAVKEGAGRPFDAGFDFAMKICRQAQLTKRATFFGEVDK